MAVDVLAVSLQVLVGLTGAGCVVAEVIRSHPKDQPWWRYLLYLPTSRYWEWQLHLAGLALFLLAGLASKYSTVLLLAALPIYVWLYFYLLKHPHGLPGRDRVAWQPSKRTQSHVRVEEGPSEKDRT